MIDLHMHSRYSEDGEFTPSELAEQCAEKGVCMMSVTDHNCAKANGEAERAAKEWGIAYVPGIEIDCTYSNMDFHVLGYGIDYQSSDFEAIEKNVADQSFQASLERLRKTREFGFCHKRICGPCQKIITGREAGRGKCLPRHCLPCRNMKITRS